MKFTLYILSLTKVYSPSIQRKTPIPVFGKLVCTRTYGYPCRYNLTCTWLFRHMVLNWKTYCIANTQVCFVITNIEKWGIKNSIDVRTAYFVPNYLALCNAEKVVIMGSCQTFVDCFRILQTNWLIATSAARARTN